MGFQYVKELISPEELKLKYPLADSLRKAKADRDHQIREIFEGKDSRFIAIIGPCSADNEDAVCEYIHHLAKVQERIKDKVFIIPRIYTNKPRTTGEGYMGLVHQPDPHKKADFEEGLHAVRKMHLRAIAETGLSAADEMLYPENFPYVDDLLSYIAVGARSVEDQQHRLTVSGMDVPVGMKNPTSGDLSVMMNSCVAAQIPHTFLYRQWEVDTTGNPLTHTILRGAVNKHGQCTQNYHYEDLMRLLSMYEARPMLKNPAVIIDANHSNSNKQFAEQPRIVHEVLHSRKMNPDLQKLVKGVMVESYLIEGTQKLEEGVYGKSITDPCLGWEATEQLLYTIAEHV